MNRRCFMVWDLKRVSDLVRGRSKATRMALWPTIGDWRLLESHVFGVAEGAMLSFLGLACCPRSYFLSGHDLLYIIIYGRVDRRNAMAYDAYIVHFPKSLNIKASTFDPRTCSHCFSFNWSHVVGLSEGLHRPQSKRFVRRLWLLGQRPGLGRELREGKHR